MPVMGSSYVTLNPSYTMPELLLPYSQASGAFDALAGGEPMVRLSDGDLLAYIRRADIRTKMAAGQSAYNELPGVSLVMSMISAPSYLLRTRSEYDHHDSAAMGRWGVSITEAYRLGSRQAHFQLLRNMLLYGLSPANGEGLLNTPSATTINLPADSNGDTTVVTYDNGEMALFLLQQILNIKTRTYQLGQGRKFTILGPQRVLGLFAYNIVQLVQYQRPGAGTASTEGVTAAVLMDNGDRLDWCYDDTLIGQGNGGTDAVIIIMPEVEKPKVVSKLNTNEFAKLAPGLEACSIQLMDMAAPKEITTPMPGGAVDTLSELRATSGWVPRPEAITIVSMLYS